MSVTKLRPSFTFTEDRLAELCAIVPEAFTDGAINWEILREALGVYLDDEAPSAEHFGLTWPGKREARRLAARPSKGTLAPAPGQGIDETTTRNLFIEGDNLEVLKLLQKSYAGRVKMIYIDPPYNTGNDFVYEDDFSEPLEGYLQKTGQMNEAGQILTTNAKAGGRFHSNWLNMMYPRLLLSRSLLSDDGIIFISIDDNEVSNLRTLLNETFGEENFIAQFIWKSRQFPDARSVTHVSTDHEYLVCFAKNIGFSLRGVERDETKFSNPDKDPRGDWMSRSMLGLANAEQRPNLHYSIKNPETEISYPPPYETGWRYSKERMSQLIEERRIIFPSKENGRPREKVFRRNLRDEYISMPTIIDSIYTAHGTSEIRDIFSFPAFGFPKPSELIRTLVEQATANEDIVLDLFAGSCSTAHAVLAQNRRDQTNRRFICVQLPERTNPNSETARQGYSTIAEIGKERIRRVIKRMQQEAKAKLDLQDRTIPEDLGFKVYMLARSNYKAWQDYTGDSITELETLFDRIETPLVEDWTSENLLTEILLLQGFPLDSAVAPQPQFTHNIVQHVTSDACAHDLYICLDPSVSAETITQLELRLEDIFICLDSALTDQAKLRLADICTLSVI